MKPKTTRPSELGAAHGSALREYWKLRKQEKLVNALEIRCACGLRKVGPSLFIFDGRAVIIKGWEDPHGREWDRLNDLMAWQKSNYPENHSR